MFGLAILGTTIATLTVKAHPTPSPLPGPVVATFDGRVSVRDHGVAPTEHGIEPRFHDSGSDPGVFVPRPDCHDLRGGELCCTRGFVCVCEGQSACNELIVACVGSRREYRGDSDAGSCDLGLSPAREHP